MRACLSHTTTLTLSKLNSLLQICTTQKSIYNIKQTHQQIIVLGQSENPFLITKLVQLYMDCDHSECAHKLFVKISQPNVFAWTALLSFYSRHGLSKECVGYYKEMKFSGVSPDKYVFPKVLRVCAQSGWSKTGSQVHKDVIFYGEELNVVVCNSLIDMYSKCSEIESAERVFGEMGERDILSWNSMISGYLSCGFSESAVYLFGSLQLESFDPDVVTYNTIQDAYFRLGQCDEALKTFQQIKEPNIISWTIMISGYSRIGEHILSLSAFRKMVWKGKVFPDLDCISSVIVSCRYLGALIYGKEIHAYGIKRYNPSTLYKSAGPAILSLYSRCKKLEDAKNVFILMDKLDVVTWNAMIFGYLDLGKENLALDCFRQMQSIGTQSDQITICTVLPVCDLESGEQIHTHILKTGFNFIISVSNALIHMYCKCGCLESASSVFSNMFALDIVTWNTMIGGFARHGLANPAIQLLKEMTDLGIFPDSVTFTSLLSACNHTGFVDEGLKIFNMMINDFMLKPRMEHYACVVDLVARSGRLEEAVDIIKKMPFEPDKRIWGALLAASQSHRNVSFGILASENLVNSEPEYSGHYVTLANIYDEAGRWDDAVSVREIMEGKGLVKPSGYSWVGS